MSGGKLFNMAKRDARHHTTKGGFQEDIILKTPTGDIVLPITGFATKHWINFDGDGNPKDSKNAHVSISESELTENGYPVRASNGEVSLINHVVSFVDSSNISKSYVVRRNLPDETLGIIVLILGDYTE